MTTARRPMPLVLTALLAATGALLAGCGSSGDGAGTTTATRAASGARTGSSTSHCPANGTAQKVALSVENMLDIPVSVIFTGVNCKDWAGTTPAAYAPINLASGPAAGGVAGFRMPGLVKSDAYSFAAWGVTLQSDGTPLGRFNVGLKAQNCDGAGNCKSAFLLQGRNGAAYMNPTSVPLPAADSGTKKARVRTAGSKLIIEYLTPPPSNHDPDAA